MANYSSLLLALFTRDLNKLKDELNLYSTESHIWKVEPNISNSAGNLTLHLIGNLNHFVGAVLGKTGYVRQRELEFSKKYIPRNILIEDIDKTIAMLTGVLMKLSNADLDVEYIFAKPDKPDSAGQFLLNLTAHLAYHLGQINYHRRLLDK
jgi:hypothetical protein